MEIPYGYCHCGCGQKTNLARQNLKQWGYIKGEPVPHLPGHNTRIKYSTERYIVDENGCWVWQHNRTFGGYPHTTDDAGKPVLAHRYEYTKKYGTIPKGYDLDHLCKNRSCINPDHCEPVTNAENIRRGKATKLNWDKVREIRRLHSEGGYTYGSLGKRYGVTAQCICLIVKRKNWDDSKTGIANRPSWRPISA